MGDEVKVLVTGGNGNLGSWVSDSLSSKGYSVTILGRTRNQFIKNRDYAFVPCDLTDREQVKSQLKGRSFDHVIHMSSANDAGTPDYGELAFRVNTMGTKYLLENLELAQLKGFQYFSTFHVYGRNSGTITEETPPSPRHDYATTHLFAEHYIQQYHNTHGLPFAIWRLSNSYGAPKFVDSTKWYLILNDLSRMAFGKKEIRLNSNGRAQRDLIWMGDVCNIVEAAIETRPTLNSIYNLGSSTSYRMLDVAHAVQAAFEETYGITLPVHLNEQDTTKHDEPLHFDCSKLQYAIPNEPSECFKAEAKKIFQLLEENQS